MSWRTLVGAMKNGNHVAPAVGGVPVSSTFPQLLRQSLGIIQMGRFQIIARKSQLGGRTPWVHAVIHVWGNRVFSLSIRRSGYLGTPPLPGTPINPCSSLPTLEHLCGSHLLFLLPPGPPHSIPTLDSMRKTYFSLPPLSSGFRSFPANPTLMTGL